MPDSKWKYTRLLREKQAMRDPAGEVRAEEACGLPSGKEDTAKANRVSLSRCRACALWVKASIFPLRHKEHLGKILTMEGVFVKVLLVGRGGREHSIAMKLYESGQVNQIYAAPGNGGISDIAVCADIDEMNIDGLAAFAVEKAIDLTIVGPENPLVAGITNKFHEAGLKILLRQNKQPCWKEANGMRRTSCKIRYSNSRLCQFYTGSGCESLYK